MRSLLPWPLAVWSLVTLSLKLWSLATWFLARWPLRPCSLGLWSWWPEWKESFSCELERWPLLVGLPLGLDFDSPGFLTGASLCFFLSRLISSSWSDSSGLLAVLLDLFFLTSAFSEDFSLSPRVVVVVELDFCFLEDTDSDEVVFCGFFLVNESDVESLSLFRGFFSSFLGWLAATCTSSVWLCERESARKSLTGLVFFFSFFGWFLRCTSAPIGNDETEADLTFPAFEIPSLSMADILVTFELSLKPFLSFSVCCLFVSSRFLSAAFIFPFFGFAALSTGFEETTVFDLSLTTKSLTTFFSTFTCSLLPGLSFVTFLGYFPDSGFKSLVSKSFELPSARSLSSSRIFFSLTPLSTFFFESALCSVLTTFIPSASLFRVSRKVFFNLSTSCTSLFTFEALLTVLCSGTSKSSTSHSNSLSSSMGTNSCDSSLSLSLSSRRASSSLKVCETLWSWSDFTVPFSSNSPPTVSPVSPSSSLSSFSSSCDSSTGTKELLTSSATDATCSFSVVSKTASWSLSLSSSTSSSGSSDWSCLGICVSTSGDESDSSPSSEFSDSGVTGLGDCGTTSTSSSSFLSSLSPSSALPSLLIGCSSSSSSSSSSSNLPPGCSSSLSFASSAGESWA